MKQRRVEIARPDAADYNSRANTGPIMLDAHRLFVAQHQARTDSANEMTSAASRAPT